MENKAEMEEPIMKRCSFIMSFLGVIGAVAKAEPACYIPLQECEFAGFQYYDEDNYSRTFAEVRCGIGT